MTEPDINEILQKAKKGNARKYTTVKPSTPKDLQIALSRNQLIYSLVALILGLACIVGGLVLFLNGVAGSTSWVASILGAKSELSDAPAGVVLFVVGFFIVFVTRYRFTHK